MSGTFRIDNPFSGETVAERKFLTPAEIEEMKRMNPTSPHERREQKEEEEFLKGDQKNATH